MKTTYYYTILQHQNKKVNEIYLMEQVSSIKYESIIIYIF